MIGEETSADVEPLRIKLGVDSMPDIKRKREDRIKIEKNIQHMVEKLNK